MDQLALDLSRWIHSYARDWTASGLVLVLAVALWRQWRVSARLRYKNAMLVDQIRARCEIDKAVEERIRDMAMTNHPDKRDEFAS